jgi:hypothetical protein
MGGGNEGYHIQVGANILKNLVLFVAAAVSPVSTVDVARAGTEWDWSVLATAGLGIAIAGGCLLGGFALARGQVLVCLLALAGASAAALFPAVLLPHVSELYLYGAMAPIGLTMAFALRILGERGGKAGRAAGILCCATLLAGGGLAVRQKSQMMAENGTRAVEMRDSIGRWVKEAPQGGEIVLVDEPSTAPRFSVYVLAGFDPVRFGEGKIGWLYGRPDVRVRLLPPELAEERRSEGAFLLRLAGGGVVRP